MTKKFMTGFFVIALAVASAANYNVTLFQPSVIAGKELKPGEYKLVVDDGKVTISQGKEKLEASVRTEASESKFSNTSVRYANADGKNKVQEIRLGGTNTRLIFNN